jgi:hypothetical protein
MDEELTRDLDARNTEFETRLNKLDSEAQSPSSSDK